MAKCEQGYRCDRCGDDVESIVQSDLYLRYVLGWIDAETLHTSPERHLRCNPALAQFIDDLTFPSVIVEGDWDRRKMDPAAAKARGALVTRGYRRLLELAERLQTGEISILDYPLPEVRATM